MAYKYELWLDGNMLTEDEGFDTEEDAEEEGRTAAEDRIYDWKANGCWDDETVDDFEIKVMEV